MNAIQFTRPLICLATILFLATNVLAQQWSKEHPLMTKSNKMLVCNGGIYVAGADTARIGALIKYDLNGNRIFRTLFNDPDSIYFHRAEIASIDTLPHTSDIIALAYATLGVTNTFMLLRIDSSGTIVWQTKFSYSTIDNPVLVDANSLPGKIVTFTADNLHRIEYNVWDTLGNNITRKPLFLNVWQSPSITKCADGYMIYYEQGQRFIRKVDFQGGTIYTKQYDWLLKGELIAINYPDGRIDFLHPFLGRYIIHEKISAKGTTLPSDTIQFPAREIKSVQSIPTGFLICGDIERIPGNPNAFALKLDSNFSNPELYENPQMESLFQLHQEGNTWIGFGKLPLEIRYLFADSIYFTPYVSPVNTIELENSASFHVTLFPNPVKGIVHVQAHAAFKKFTASVFDMNGILKYHSANLESESLDINLSHFTPGVYTLICTDEDGGTTATKLLKE